MGRKLVLLLFIAGIAVVFSRADAGPPPGYVAVPVKTILRYDDDLSDYRFFVIAYNLGREIKLEKGADSVVPWLSEDPYGEGAVYAVPRTSLSDYPGQISDSQMETLAGALADQQVAGAVLLFRHKFYREVRRGDASMTSDERYQVVRTSDGLKAQKASAPAVTDGGSYNTWLGVSAFIVLALCVCMILATRYARKGQKE